MLITFCESRRRRKMYCGRPRLCVCLSEATCPHYCTEPDVTWGSGRGCLLVVHYWAHLQSVLWQHNANPSYKFASIQWYDDMVRTLSGVCARCWPVSGRWGGRPQNCVPYMGSGRGWLAGDWPSSLLQQPGLQASTGGILATQRERKMLASTCLYLLYA